MDDALDRSERLTAYAFTAVIAAAHRQPVPVLPHDLRAHLTDRELYVQTCVMMEVAASVFEEVMGPDTQYGMGMLDERASPEGLTAARMFTAYLNLDTETCASLWFAVPADRKGRVLAQVLSLTASVVRAHLGGSL